jgi:segregation and condensation protein B
MNDEIAYAVEALLFAAGAPVKVTDLCVALQADTQEVEEGLRSLAATYAGGGVELVQVAGGWQLRSSPRFATAVLRLRGGKPQKLSPQALEVLAVVAYKQPVTRTEVELLRGVDSGGVLKALLDRGVVRVAGRREEPGRPLEYATTDAFLELFGLPSLSSLPTLREREELLADHDGAKLPLVEPAPSEVTPTPE